MTNAEIKEKVLQAIKNMKNDDLALAYFDFCRLTGYEPVYSMDEIDDIFLTCHRLNLCDSCMTHMTLTHTKNTFIMTLLGVWKVSAN